MCIIAVKSEGVPMPSDSIIRKMFSSNSHGAGFMIKRKRSKLVEISKGHMTLEDFKKALNKAKVKDSDILVMHFRIATAGGRSQRLTHPFVCVENADDAEILNGKTDQLCLAHNGTISEFSIAKSKRSDSSLFASEIMSSKAIADNLDDKVIQELITDKLAGTRLAVINPKEHKVHIFGEFAKSENDYKWNKSSTGMYYSNYSWVPNELKVYRGYSTDYYGEQDEYSPIGNSYDDTHDFEGENQLSIEDFSHPKDRGTVFGSTKEAEGILDDFGQLSPEYQDSFLEFMEMTKAEFVTVVNNGMTTDQYVDKCTAWMNSLGYGDDEPNVEDVFSSDKKKEPKAGYKVGRIKTKDGWIDLATSDEVGKN